MQNPDSALLHCFATNVYSVDCKFAQSVDSTTKAMSNGLRFAGYGSVCEGCALMIMLVSFIVAGVLCVRRFYAGTTLRSSEVGRRNSKVRRQIMATVATVFFTFLLRLLLAAALALSRLAEIDTPFDDKSNCEHQANIFCDECQALGVIVQSWLWMCPAFSFTVFALSSPVTILIALWGMTTDIFLQRMWSGFRRKRTHGDSMKSFIKAGGGP
jgi:hypothetical protein